MASTANYQIDRDFQQLKFPNGVRLKIALKSKNYCGSCNMANPKEKKENPKMHETSASELLLKGAMKRITHTWE